MQCTCISICLLLAWILQVGSTFFRRLGWSPCGHFIASTHGFQNPSHTAPVLERGEWLASFDFVGHIAPVVAVRFNHSMFRKARKMTEFSHFCCTRDAIDCLSILCMSQWCIFVACKFCMILREVVQLPSLLVSTSMNCIAESDILKFSCIFWLRWAYCISSSNLVQPLHVSWGKENDRDSDWCKRDVIDFSNYTLCIN